MVPLMVQYPIINNVPKKEANQMKKTALEEEILEDINHLKEEWGIEEPLRLSGGFYQNYCNLSVTNRKIRKKKRQTWGGSADSGTGIFARDGEGMA